MPLNRIQRDPFFIKTKKSRHFFWPLIAICANHVYPKKTTLFCISLVAHVYNTIIRVPLPPPGLMCYNRYDYIQDFQFSISHLYIKVEARLTVSASMTFLMNWKALCTIWALSVSCIIVTVYGTSLNIHNKLTIFSQENNCILKK